MSERDAQFLEFYQKCRFQDQQAFYGSRIKEFDAAHRQITYLTAVLLGLSTLTATLAATDAGGQRVMWAFLAVLFPAVSTAVSAYQGLYAFERHAKLYRDALNALINTAVEAPDRAASADTIRAYVTLIEGILRNEQRQWGQLAREIKLVESGTPKQQARDI